MVTAIINSSLTKGVVPASFKHAIVQPMLKKPQLDPEMCRDYQPISKLPFISKLLEKVFFSQLQFYLNSFNILDKYLEQSGFRLLHSTESALLRVTNDILLALDSGSCVVLVLLVLSTAFDTIDHNILLEWLEYMVGVRGTVLKLFKYLIAINHINVIVNSRLIAINHTFLSILNVP